MISRYGIFCKVAELGSFTRAAEACGYSQSAISQNIKALEQETEQLHAAAAQENLKAPENSEE